MRFLHTMLRVGDLQRSIDFYTRVMGMKVHLKGKGDTVIYRMVGRKSTDAAEPAPEAA